MDLKINMISVKDWKVIRLGDFAIYEKGKKPKKLKKEKDKNYTIPYIDILAFEKGIISKYTDGDGCVFCDENDFLMVWDGSRSGLVGKALPGALGSTLMRIRIPELEEDFLYYFLKSKYLDLNTRTKGTGTPHVDPELLWNYEFPLPPLPEQRAIVARIEELFSRLDKGIETLQQVKQQLKVYRQAVLKWAFEGKLTAEWRGQQKAKGMLPTAEELLEQIKAERERHYQQKLEEWQKAVEEWETNGKQGKKPVKPNKPKELPPLTEEEIAGMPHLPGKWVWIRLGSITLGVEYGTSLKSQKTGKVPVLRMGNIQNFRFVWDDLVYTDNDEEINKYLLKKGDVLFNRTNSPELVGKTAVFKGERKAIFAGYLIRINHLQSLINSDYINYFLNSIFAKNYGNQVKTDGVNQSNINGNKLIHYPLPYCSLIEQQAIVQEIETRLSVADKLEQIIDESLQKAEALRQSILKRAFEGKLLSEAEREALKNDPDWEPAEKLLERIKAEKEALEKTKQTTRKNKK
ncbi:restriction endonuclease subunit S [Calditrichota bacterium LG25]